MKTTTERARLKAENFIDKHKFAFQINNPKVWIDEIALEFIDFYLAELKVIQQTEITQEQIDEELAKYL
jgi:hypothetical protein